MPLVSVVLPVHNAERSVGACIESILEQSFRDFELIVNNDGSKDTTLRYVEKFAARDARIRVISQENTGVAGAMNAAVARAQGAFVARIDADDLMHPERLADQTVFLREHPGIGVAGSLVEFGGDRQAAAGYARFVDWTNQLVDDAAIRRNRFVEQPLVNPSVMFRRELWERHGGCRDGDFPEDYELWLRWLDAGVRMAKVPRKLLVWNDPPTRLTRNHARYSIDAFYRIKAHYLAKELRRRRPEPVVWIWGAGKTTRQRAEFLAEEGVGIEGYIDIDPRKVGQVIGGKPVIAPEELGQPGETFVIAMVGSRGAREKIRKWLEENRFRECEDFFVAA